MTVMQHNTSSAPRADRLDPLNVHLSRSVRFVVTLASVLVGLFVFGFALFAAVVMREPTLAATQADGILVLTGGDYRIVEGARLLREGRAERLLISGVNSKTTRDDLLKLTGLDATQFNCCVELGYSAQDTVGNAEEARTWVSGRKLKRLIVVTSSYHMPRSLAELAIAMPDTELIAHTVIPRTFRNQAWWLHPNVTRLMLSEYVKFLPVAARLKSMRYYKPASTVTADRPLVSSKS
jgi:uncharacterized SAM-binding protein YcdF (DUF218 family)